MNRAIGRSVALAAGRTSNRATQFLTGAVQTLLLMLITGVISAQDAPLSITADRVVENELVLTPLPLGLGRWAPRPSDDDSPGFVTAHADRYVIRYRYDEQALMPSPGSRCYLDLYAIPLTGVTPATRAWYDRWELDVRGKFVDRQVTLPILLQDSKATTKANLEFNAHQADATRALSLEERAAIVATGGATSLALKVTNNTPFSIHVRTQDVRVTAVGDALLDTHAPREANADHSAITIERVPDRVSQHAVVKLEVRVKPRTWQAFWASLALYSPETPHDWLTVRIPFRVDNGGQGLIEERLPIKYKPSGPLLLLAVAFGSVLGYSFQRFFVAHSGADATSEPRPQTGPHVANDTAAKPAPARQPSGATDMQGIAAAPAAQQTTVVGSRWSAWLLRLAAWPRLATAWLWRVAVALWPITVTIFLSWAIYFAYFLTKGDKQVIVYDIALDPSQVLPSWFVGVLVGLKSSKWYQALSQLGGAAPARGAGMPLLVAAALAFTACHTAEAGTGGFRPVAIALDNESGVMLVLSSPENVIYQVLDGDRVVPRAQLDRFGVTTDMCIGGQGERTWFAVAIVTPAARDNSVWRSTFFIGRVEDLVSRGQWERIVPDAPWGGYSSIACTRDDRLLAVDSTYGEVRAFQVLDGKSITRDAARGFFYRRASTIATVNGMVFVGSSDDHEVVEIDPTTRSTTRRRLLEVTDPRGMSVSPDGRFLLLSDAAAARVHSYDLRAPRATVVLAGNGLHTPVGVLMDMRGALWIADEGARALLRVRDGKVLSRISRPAN